jgi:hypothetical protein
MERTVLRCTSALAALLLAGCTRTVMVGQSRSPDKSYVLWGKVCGAYGHSFMEDTAKTIRISIEKSGSRELLFRKDYNVKGTDVGWKATWRGNTNVSVVLLQYPPGAYSFDTNSIPSNVISTMTFVFDSQTSKFVEALRTR